MKILTADIGSTYTKLNLIDSEKAEVLAHSLARTTVEEDVKIGFDIAYEKIHKFFGTPDVIFGCSSAAGGLKASVVGFSKNLTTHAAKLAVLNSGARILNVYSYELTDDDLMEIKNADSDIVILCGGIDGGNELNILHNAKRLSELENITVVVAGNKFANEKIDEIFNKKGLRHHFCENVMPATNWINYLPLRNKISEIFINTIAGAKGMSFLSEKFKIFKPTPVAVQHAVSNYSKWLGEELMSVDIGGATTDIMSIGKSYSGREDILPPEVDEPYEKRSVEGDMGMRYSALSMYENATEKFSEIKTAEQKCQMRSEDPFFIAEDKEEIDFDTFMAKVAIDTAIRRHAGHLKRETTENRFIYRQSGKDTTSVSRVIGTGGVIVHSDCAKEILKSVEVPEILSPKNPDYYVDSHYVLSASGLISYYDEKLGAQILDRYLKKL